MLMRDGTSVEDVRLGRIVSATSEHIDKYPLTASTMPAQKTDILGGFNWYSNFDKPVLMKQRDGKWRHVIGYGPLGHVRGGHGVCMSHWDVRDRKSWWRFYNQRLTDRCVEFALLRVQTHANRKMYDITSAWHYFTAQRNDEWAGGQYPGAVPQYGGTSVRAGLDVAYRHGLVQRRYLGRPVAYESASPVLAEGISRYRWARTWQDVREVLGVPDWLPGVPVQNSWGKSYPQEVLLLDSAGERMLREDGEFGVVTDR